MKKTLLVAEAQSGEVGDSGRGLQQLLVLGAKHLHMIFELRSRTDQLHFALQNIHQLRQFIQFVFSQNAPDPRDSRVMRSGHRAAGSRAGNHAPEFQESEHAKVFANAQVGIQNRAAVVQFDGNCDQGERGSQNHQPRRGTGEIEKGPQPAPGSPEEAGGGNSRGARRSKSGLLSSDPITSGDF